MPSVRFLVAASSLSLTLAYLLIRKCRNKNCSTNVDRDQKLKSVDIKLNILPLDPPREPKEISNPLVQNSETNSTFIENEPEATQLISETITEGSKQDLNAHSNISSSLLEEKNLTPPLPSQDHSIVFEESDIKQPFDIVEPVLAAKANFLCCNKLEIISEELNSEKTTVSDASAKSSENTFKMPGSLLHIKSRHLSSAGSENVSPKDITPETSSNCSYAPDSIPSGYFNDPENDIVEDSPEIFFGKQVPKVLIPNEIWKQISDDSIWTDTFCIPARMGGVLIGRFGKNVRELRSQWKAEFSLNMSPDNQDMLLFKIACPIEYKSEVLNWVSQRFKMRPSRTTIGNPNQLRRYLPFGKTTPVQVRSSYGLKEMFVTVPDEKFVKFLEMQREMDLDYSTYAKQRMQLCEPVTSGTVAVLPHSQGFARALILKVFHIWPIKYALYFLLDHGVFGLIQLNELRKIRAKYMRVPFQAIHVSWAHALPLFNDMPELHLLRTYFASGQIHATAIRMETCCRASVVFTDLMVVSNGLQDTVPSSVNFPDIRSFPPLTDKQSMPLTELKMVDVLAMCCRAGLFMVSPLILNPSRQCWLNQSDTPYYTYNGGEIDYQSYVSYVLEDGSINSSPSPNSEQQMAQASKRRKSRRSKNKKNGKQNKPEFSADEKENQSENLLSLSTKPDANNNNNVERPANNPWGKATVQVEAPPVVEPVMKETSDSEPGPEEKPAVKLTMAQIVAMAPPPKPKSAKPSSSAAASVPKPTSNPMTNGSSTKKRMGVPPTDGIAAASRRKPLKARNSQNKQADAGN